MTRKTLARIAFSPLSIVILAVIALIGLSLSTRLATAASGGKTSATHSVPMNAPLGTGFTYQGYLERDNATVDMACNFQFSLWEAESGGTQLGAIQTVSNLDVSAGRFTAELNDSGQMLADPFTGRARFLQVAVNCPGDSAAFTALTPRHKLTATPYALSVRPGATISGTVGTGNGALNLNSNADGLRISAANHGIYLDATGGNALNVSSPSDVGLYIRSATNGIEMDQMSSNGMYINGVQQNGVHVRHADNNGMQIDSYGNIGIQVQGGVTTTELFAGFFSGGVKILGGCDGCDQTLPTRNVDGATLQPGDIVAVAGVEASPTTDTQMIMTVRKAGAGDTPFGVVIGVAQAADIGGGMTTLVPQAGLSAESGAYVSILTRGMAQVNVDSAQAFSVGDRLALGDNGTARALLNTQVNGVKVVEAAATLGIALEDPASARSGQIWVFVNPQ